MLTPSPSQELLKYHFDPRVVPPCGTGSSGILCCAESPGRHESEEGIVLHPKADAGSVFDRALRRAKIPRESLTLTNVVWMRPPSNELADTPYLWEARQYWMPFNEALIQERQPKVIVLLGNVSLGAFTEFGASEKTTIQHLQGYTLIDSKRNCYLLPSLHPSFILHGQQAHTQTLIWALQRAFQLAREGLKPLPTRYVTHPTEADMLIFEQGFNPDRHILDYDIETPESAKLDEAELEDTEEDISYNILRASMCYDPVSGYAISFPWQSPFIEMFKRMMFKAQRRGVWNNYFDEPRIHSSGVVTPGTLIDRMQSWRFLQPTLPASLEYASPLLGWTNPPWKYKSDSDPEEYSATDAHALAWNGMKIEEALRARGMLDCHDRHVTKVYEITQKMSRNGLPYCVTCDICAKGGKCEELPEDAPEHAACATGFKRKLEKLKKEREDELQIRVPDELKPTKQAHGYKKTPKSLERLVKRAFAVVYSNATLLEQEAVKVNASEPTLKAIAEFPDQFKIQVERWAQLKPFLPTSHVQMKKLIKWGGFKVGTNRKTKKETSDDETKRKIIARCINSPRKKDQEFGVTLKMCREVSQLSKVLGTYVKGWRVGTDGRVHAIPGFWGKMFRISWRNPNISGTIQDKQEEFIAAGFRKCVRTSQDRVLVESDWRGIEAVLVGVFADDPDYVRLAKIGVHDYLCCHILATKGKILYSDIPSLSLSDAELKIIFKGIKKRFPKDRDDSKHVVHASNYLATPSLISSMYEMPLKETEHIQAIYFSEVAAKVKAWQGMMLAKAHSEVYLKNVYGYQMAFWEIYRWNSHRYEILAKMWSRIGKMGADGMPWKPNLRERTWIREIEQILKADPAMKVEDGISKLCWDLGDDAKSAISFLPRDTAAGMLRELLLRVEPLVDDGFLCASAHDAVLCDCPRSQQSRVEEILYTEMTRPVPQLKNAQYPEGLIVDVEVKAGPSWDSDNMEVREIRPILGNNYVDKSHGKWLGWNLP
jgi:uracil-DNA glycosylase family 4